MAPPAGGYQALALVYDRWQRMYGKSYSALILPRLLATLRTLHIPRGTLADLACGTGTLAIAMARRGWTVWGIDASPLMLAEAERKQAGRSRCIGLVTADMRTFRLPQPVDVVTSLFDSLNHLPSQADLRRTFRSVASSLAAGGWFIFDVNNEQCYRTLWTRTEAVHHRDFTLVLNNGYASRRRDAYALVTLFLREGSRHRKLNDLVREHYFPASHIREALRGAGFRVAGMEEFSFTARTDLGPLKQWWVAQKE
jgi:SAM-dependent methyltransferase